MKEFLIFLLIGAEQLLRHLHKHKIPFALATSSSAASYELKTKQVKPLFEIFHHRVLGGSDPDVKNGKPAPDIFLVAASRFSDNPDPSKVCFFFLLILKIFLFFIQYDLATIFKL